MDPTVCWFSLFVGDRPDPFTYPERVMENRYTRFPYTDDQIQRIMQVYNDLSEGARTSPALIPALAWYIALILHDIESNREVYQNGHPELSKAGIRGFKLEQKPKQLAGEPWYFKAAMTLLICVLFGSHKVYWRRLVRVKEGLSVDLLGFRRMLKELLNEWSDSNLLVSSSCSPY